MTKSIFNLNQNLAAALAYLLGPFTGLIFYIGESATGNNNKFVMFHALQSTMFFGLIMILQFVLGIIPFTGLINWALQLISFVALVYLMFNAYTGKTFKIPYIGDSCWNVVNK